MHILENDNNVKLQGVGLSGAAARTKFLMNMVSVYYLKYKKRTVYKNNASNTKPRKINNV